MNLNHIRKTNHKLITLIKVNLISKSIVNNKQKNKSKRYNNNKMIINKWNFGLKRNRISMIMK